MCMHSASKLKQRNISIGKFKELSLSNSVDNIDVSVYWINVRYDLSRTIPSLKWRSRNGNNIPAFLNKRFLPISFRILSRCRRTNSAV